jgi:hypothetical protein
MWHAVFPLSLIKSLHSIKNPITVDLSAGPVTLEHICIEVEISAFTMPQSGLELSLVSLGVRGNPNTFSVVHIILPLPQVNISILMLENTSARSLTILDLALVC